MKYADLETVVAERLVDVLPNDVRIAKLPIMPKQFKDIATHIGKAPLAVFYTWLKTVEEAVAPRGLVKRRHFFLILCISRSLSGADELLNSLDYVKEAFKGYIPPGTRLGEFRSPEIEQRLDIPVEGVHFGEIILEVKEL